jgi:Zn-dependent oligopeptidase
MLYDYTTATVKTVNEETDAAIGRADALVADAVAASPSFDTTLLPLELAAAELVRAYGRGAFLGQVHTDSEVRDAGNEAEERLNKWRVAVAFRTDLYRAVRAFTDTDEAKGLEGERKRLLEHWLRDFRRAGHELSADDRAELERLRTRLVEVEVAFQRNVNEYRDGIDVTRDQLAGLPDSYIERLSAGGTPDTYRVSLDYPELNPFLDQARDRELRHHLFTKNWNRAVEENRPLLDEALDLRRRIAALLGEPTWAHHAMELKMARNPERVRTFYEELLPSLAGTVRRELDRRCSRPTAMADRSPPGTGATTTTHCGAPSTASTRTGSASTSRSIRPWRACSPSPGRSSGWSTASCPSRTPGTRASASTRSATRRPAGTSPTSTLISSRARESLGTPPPSRSSSVTAARMASTSPR